MSESVKNVPGTPRPIGVAILAMGGEGGGVLADWIVDLAEHEGYPAQTTSVPGVAQRTGATIYYVEFHPQSVDVHEEGRQPVLALVPVPGDVDIVIASELMEMGRAIQRGLVTPDKTVLIASTHRVYSMTEKISMGDGRVDPAPFMTQARRAAKQLVHADFAQLAERNGSVISAALFGALAGAGALPFSREQFEAAIQRAGVGVQSSLKAFAAGFETALKSDEVDQAIALTEVAPVAGKVVPLDIGATRNREIVALDRRIREQFPAPVHDILHRAVRRLADYQDARHATEYLNRLQRIAALEPTVSDARLSAGTLLEETARHLALWMSYEDTVRVADLKIRASRFARVRDEVKGNAEQIVHINEYLHPRLDEIADTLPASLGARLLRPGVLRNVVKRITRNGKVVRTTSLRGFLLLYCVSSMRAVRRRSLRFAREEAQINGWLANIARHAGRDYALAVEIARSQRLVKGYGDTHERGMRNFARITATLPALEKSVAPALRLRTLCEAALADEQGARLDALLADYALPSSMPQAGVAIRAEPASAH